MGFHLCFTPLKNVLADRVTPQAPGRPVVNSGLHIPVILSCSKPCLDGSRGKRCEALLN